MRSISTPIIIEYRSFLYNEKKLFLVTLKKIEKKIRTAAHTQHHET